MRHLVRLVLLMAVVFGVWAFGVRLRYAPAPLGRLSAPPMPSFRPLSPYPLVTEIPTDPPRPTPDPKLSCPPDMVKVDNFCIDRYEFPNRKGAMPRTMINWYQAQAECAKLGKRLCTEDEWIRACDGSPGGGKLRRYSYGDTFVLENCNVQNTHAVPSGTFTKCRSAWGAYDMVGNVYEWVQPRPGSRIYTLGGAWGEGRGASCYKAGAGYQPGYYQEHIGFRCCK